MNNKGYTPRQQTTILHTKIEFILTSIIFSILH